jgi:Pectate lyase superfamily protein
MGLRQNKGGSPVKSLRSVTGLRPKGRTILDAQSVPVPPPPKRHYPTSIPEVDTSMVARARATRSAVSTGIRNVLPSTPKMKGHFRLTYTPTNLTVYTAAYSGAVSGLVASSRDLEDPLESAYTGFASIAGAFAAAFDTQWSISPDTTPNTLQVFVIEKTCKAVWESRSAIVNPDTLNAGSFVSLCKAIIALILASDDYFTSQGITPDPWPVSTSPLPSGTSNQVLTVEPGGTTPVFRTTGSYNVMNYGALGNGTGDDTAAIQATINTCLQNGGGEVLIPPGTYLLTAPIEIVNPGGFAGALQIVVKGYSTNVNGSTPVNGTNLVANGFYGGMIVVSGIVHLSHLALNANHRANYCIVRSGDSLSTYDHIVTELALYDGFTTQVFAADLAITAVTQTGPGPAMTVSLLDPRYGIVASAVIKITVGGALGTAQYVVSWNGGTSYDPQVQTVYNNSSPQDTEGSGVYNSNSGILCSFQAGTYEVNTTYAWTVTSSVSPNVDDTCRFIECQSSLHGTSFNTAGISPSNPVHGYNPVLATGTVSTTIGSALIVGSGTAFLSMGLRAGDMMYIPGSNSTVEDRHQILAILDDFHIAVYTALAPTANLSNVDFSTMHGWAYFEFSMPDANISLIDGGHFAGCPGGIRTAGLYGPTVVGTQIDGMGYCGVSVGQGGNAQFGSIFIRPYFESNCPCFYLTASTDNVTILSPNSDGFEAQPPVGITPWMWIGGAQLNGQNQMSNSVPMGTSRYLDDTSYGVTDSSANLAGPNPTVNSGTNIPSYIALLNGSASIVELTVPQTFVAPTADGIEMHLTATASPVTLYDHTTTGSGMYLHAPVVTLPGSGSSLRLISEGGFWVADGVDKFANSGGAWATADKVTTDATSVDIVKAILFNLPNTIEATVVAYNPATGDGASWTGISAMAIAGTIGGAGTIVGSVTIAETRGTNGGAPPTGWNITVTAPADGYMHLQVTGVAATTIWWRVKYLITNTNAFP